MGSGQAGMEPKRRKSGLLSPPEDLRPAAAPGAAAEPTTGTRKGNLSAGLFGFCLLTHQGEDGIGHRPFGNRSSRPIDPGTCAPKRCSLRIREPHLSLPNASARAPAPTAAPRSARSEPPGTWPCASARTVGHSGTSSPSDADQRPASTRMSSWSKERHFAVVRAAEP
jgi:hypothetical protein